MKKIKIFFFCFLCVQLFTFADIPWSSKDVMLQGFYWDSYRGDMGFGDTRWSSLNNQAEEISEYFTLIWLPPSACSTGGVGYVPRQWCNQNSEWGSQPELKKLIKHLHQGGCKVIADIVVNHKSGWNDWADFSKEDFGKYGTYQLGAQHICSGDEYSGPKGNGGDDGENCGYSRDLCHSDQYVQKTVIAYLKWMKDEIGYDGWRWDNVKGFHPWHVGHYNDESKPYISIGEYYDYSYDALMWWIREAWRNSMAFDFTFKHAVNDAFKSFDFTKLCWKAGNDNQPAGLIHHVDSRQFAVTFLENHDTYGKWGADLCDSGDKARILQASAFQLCAPGIPCVFYPHWQKYKKEIKPMIEARKNAGIHSNSNIDVNRCEHNLYVATIHGDNGRLIVKIGNGNYNAPNDFKLITFGQDFAIWACYTKTPSFSKQRINNSSSTSSYAVALNSIDCVKVYPNPTSDYLTIQKTDLRRIEIYSLLKGKLVMSQYVQNNQKINISNLPIGVYLLKTIDNKNKIETCKIIKR